MSQLKSVGELIKILIKKGVYHQDGMEYTSANDLNGMTVYKHQTDSGELVEIKFYSTEQIDLLRGGKSSDER